MPALPATAQQAETRESEDQTVWSVLRLSCRVRGSCSMVSRNLFKENEQMPCHSETQPTQGQSDQSPESQTPVESLRQLPNAWLTLAEIAEILGVPLNIINTMADALRFSSELIDLTKYAWTHDVQKALKQRDETRAEHELWFKSQFSDCSDE